MSGIWLPPRYENEIQRDQIRAGVFQMVQRFSGVMDYWTHRFREELNEPRCECVFFPPHAEMKHGVKPGRYHFLRDNTATAPTLIPLETPDGLFCEPHSGHVEMLRDMDLQNPQVVRAHRELQERREKEAERAKELEAEQRQEEILDRFNAAFRTSVSMSRNGKWTQNVKGRK